MEAVAHSCRFLVHKNVLEFDSGLTCAIPSLRSTDALTVVRQRLVQKARAMVGCSQLGTRNGLWSVHHRIGHFRLLGIELLQHYSVGDRRHLDCVVSVFVVANSKRPAKSSYVTQGRTPLRCAAHRR